MIDLVTSISLWDLVKHAKSWIINLKRAQDSRKNQSKAALRKVIVVTRKTRVYIRQLIDVDSREHSKEAELTEIWTELGYILEDLNLKELSQKCLNKGTYWSDPETLNKKNLEKTNNALKKIEQLATEILDTLK